MSRNIFLLVTAVVAIGATAAQAQTLSQTSAQIGPQGSGSVNISVVPGSASYSSTASGTLGDGTLEDYVFLDGPTTAIEGASSLISGLTFDFSGTNSTGIGNLTTISGGAAAPVSAAIANNNPNDVLGTVDISGFQSGTVSILYGTFVNEALVSATLSGPGAASISADGDLTVRGNAGTGTYITDFAFTNDGTLDTLSFNLFNSDTLGGSADFTFTTPGGSSITVSDGGESAGTQDASRSRLLGVVVDGVSSVPEPSSVAVLAMMGLGLAFRRQRG